MSITPILIIGFFTAPLAQPIIHQLDNGLNLFILEERTLPLVSVQLWFAAGQAHDPPDRPGLTATAQALLAARGPELETSRDRSAAPKPVSAILHSDWQIYRDACRFETVTTPDNVESVLIREARRLRPGEITKSDFEAALSQAASRAAISQGRDSRIDPNNPLMRQIIEALFVEHPYRHQPGFVSETLRDLTPAELAEHVKRRFAPANATIFVIGDVSAPRIETLARQLLEDLPGGAIQPALNFPRVKAETISISSKLEREPALTLAWRTAPLGYFENAAIDVLMERLCNPIDGRLAGRLAEMEYQPPIWERWEGGDSGALILRIIRSADPSVAQSLAAYDQPKTALRSALSAEKNPNLADDPTKNAATDWSIVAGVVDEELTWMVENRSTPIEHDRARNLAARRLLDRRVSFSQRAREIAEYHVIAGDFALSAYAPARVAAVGVSDVRSAALTLREARKVVCRPDGPATTAPSESIPGAAQPTRELQAEITERREVRVNDRVKATILLTPGRPLAEVSTIILADGLTVRDCQAALNAGSKLHTAAEIRDYLSYHGLDLAAFEDRGSVGFLSRGPVARTASMLEIQWELTRRLAGDTRDTAAPGERLEIVIAADVDFEQISKATIEILTR